MNMNCCPGQFCLLVRNTHGCECLRGLVGRATMKVTVAGVVGVIGASGSYAIWGYEGNVECVIHTGKRIPFFFDADLLPITPPPGSKTIDDDPKDLILDELLTGAGA